MLLANPSSRAFCFARSQIVRVAGLCCSATSINCAKVYGWTGSRTAAPSRGVSRAAQSATAAGEDTSPAHCPTARAAEKASSTDKSRTLDGALYSINRNFFRSISRSTLSSPGVPPQYGCCKNYLCLNQFLCLHAYLVALLGTQERGFRVDC